MISDIAIELINITAGTNYKPTFISTDKRIPAGTPTTLGYYQIGDVSQQGFARGPVFKIEVVDITDIIALGTIGFIKVWGIENNDDDAPLYPLSYFDQTKTTNKVINVWLKKIEFLSGDKVTVIDPGVTVYTIVGHKKKVIPFVW